MDHIPRDEPRPLITNLIPSPSVNVYPGNWQQYPEFVHKTVILFIYLKYLFMAIAIARCMAMLAACHSAQWTSVTPDEYIDNTDIYGCWYQWYQHKWAMVD